MKVIHQCQSTVGWQPVAVLSSTQTQNYVVHVNPWKNVDEDICECKAYLYRGKCRHQAMARAKICGWHEQIGPEEQTDADKRVGRCPRCQGPTIRFVEEANDQTGCGE